MSKFKKKDDDFKGKDVKGIVEIRIILRKKGGVSGFPEPNNRKETIILEDTTVGEVYDELNALMFPPELDEEEE